MKGIYIMINLFKKWFGCSKDVPEQIKYKGTAQLTDCHDDEVVKKMADLIIAHCESSYIEKPPFSITEKTNFKQDLHFDKSDMGLIIMRMQEEFQIKLPKGSTFFNRPADDTDYTVGDLLAAYGMIEQNAGAQHETLEEKEGKSIFADLLPSFTDMDKDPTAEEIVRVAALTETILNLTFKNPFPIEQDPLFKAVFQANTQSITEGLERGQLNENVLNIRNHDELKQIYESKYPEQVVKEMVELDYWKMRMVEHVILTKSLGPKPAYNCLEASYQLMNYVSNPSFINPLCILIINYAHLLLKFSMLKIVNPVAIGDITRVLKEASRWLDFEEGINYNHQG